MTHFNLSRGLPKAAARASGREAASGAEAASGPKINNFRRI
jgi:hypothetical protein